MVCFDNMPIDLSASYGGSDQKRGIIYKNTRYMLKLSDRISNGHTDNLNSSYSNSAISEYLCCHIIESIGIQVQNTLLGTLHRWSDYHGCVIDDIVVACENFVDNEHTLVEFKQLANSILPSKVGKIPKISEIYDTLQENVYFTKSLAEQALERFWDTFIIDALLGNFDRHGNNWGYLVNTITSTVSLAPVYDCGSCLYPQISDTGIDFILADDREIEKRIRQFPNAALLLDDGTKANYSEFIFSGCNKDCDAALLRIIPRIDLIKINKIIDLVEGISEKRRNFYKYMIKRRYNSILIPRFNSLMKANKLSTF